MSAVFLKVLNMSIAAGWLILTVTLLRLLLKKAPKWSMCLLWALAAVRLVIPFSFESIFSLIPSSETVPANIEMMPQPAIDSGVGVINESVNPVIGSLAPDPGMAAGINPLQAVVPLLGIIWLLGACAMLIYALASFRKLKKSVAASVPAEEGVMACDEVPSPFILGLFRPLIYLPSGMEGKTREFVLDHERAHIKRRDHFWKPLGFLILAIHWFNPLCWLAYILLCRDIEAACDEKVIRDMDKEAVAAYSQALLDCSFPRKRIAACPLAFGEVGVKERVKNVLNYKKPAFWIILLAVIACVIAAVCFLTDPKKDPEPTETETHKTFTAVVTRVAGRQMFVRPMDGMSELSSSDTFDVSTQDMDFEPAIGDILEIDYNGMIQEVYPARLEKIWSIRLIRKEETIAFQCPGIYQNTEGYMVVDDDPASVEQMHPYVRFSDGMNWRAGMDPAMSYGLSGKYTQDGGRILLYRQRSSNAPVEAEATIELQILSETELKVIRATAEAGNILIREGDVLVYQEEIAFSPEPVAGRTYEGTNLITAYVTMTDYCVEVNYRVSISFEAGNKWSGGHDGLVSYHVEGEYAQEDDRITLRRTKGGNSYAKDDFYLELQILSDTDVKVVRLGEAAQGGAFAMGDIFTLRGGSGGNDEEEILREKFPE